MKKDSYTSLFLPLLAVLLIFFCSSCKKDNLVDYNADFLGEWHSDTLILKSTGQEVEIFITIEEDYCEYGFMCELDCLPCVCQTVASGSIQINRKRKKIYAGDLKNKKVKLSLDREPFINSSGVWEFTLNGAVMYKR